MMPISKDLSRLRRGRGTKTIDIATRPPRRLISSKHISSKHISINSGSGSMSSFHVCFPWHNDLAGKLVGMLLEFPEDEESASADSIRLFELIEEAILVLY